MLRATITLLCIATFSCNASAEVTLYDSQGFEDPPFVAGENLFLQDEENNPWLVYGLNPDTYEVGATVGAGGTQGVQGNGTGNTGVAYAWTDLHYFPESDKLVRIQVDIARTLTAPNVADSSPVYAVDVADFDLERTTRFGLIQRDGVIRTFVNVYKEPEDEEDPPTMPLLYGDPISENTFVHFDVFLDYEEKLVTLFTNGVFSEVDFNFAASDTLDSAALQVGALPSVSSDVGYFDNYKVSTVLKGDYNFDGFVDAADYVVWSKTDFRGEDGYTDWFENFGNSEIVEIGAGGAVPVNGQVPEPAGIALLTTALGLSVLKRRRRSDASPGLLE